MSADLKWYATEWADADIRVLRHGDTYELQLRVRDDVGCQQHFAPLPLTESQAKGFSEIWLARGD
jgi:hypothetical protein